MVAELFAEGGGAVAAEGGGGVDAEAAGVEGEGEGAFEGGRRVGEGDEAGVELAAAVVRAMAGRPRLRGWSSPGAQPGQLGSRSWSPQRRRRVLLRAL
ncbi:MAG: hypothetical protein R3F65_00210 [bacterium]